MINTAPIKTLPRLSSPVLDGNGLSGGGTEPGTQSCYAEGGCQLQILCHDSNYRTVSLKFRAVIVLLHSVLFLKSMTEVS